MVQEQRDTIDAEDLSVEVYLAEDFATFYRRELPSIVALLYATCGNRWAAEDLAHDAFIATHRRWDEVARYDRPGAFLRRVALNLAHSRARRMGAEARAIARLARGRRPSLEMVGPETAEFWAAVRRLPRRQAEVMALHYADDLSTAEIAAVLGCAEATVRVHLHRARQTLADRLGEQP